MSEKYIKNHFDDIKKYANIIENRIDDEDCRIETILKDNSDILELCQIYNVNYVFIDENYQISIEL